MNVCLGYTKDVVVQLMKLMSSNDATFSKLGIKEEKIVSVVRRRLVINYKDFPRGVRGSFPTLERKKIKTSKQKKTSFLALSHFSLF